MNVDLEGVLNKEGFECYKRESGEFVFFPIEETSYDKLFNCKIVMRTSPVDRWYRYYYYEITNIDAAIAEGLFTCEDEAFSPESGNATVVPIGFATIAAGGVIAESKTTGDRFLIAETYNFYLIKKKEDFSVLSLADENMQWICDQLGANCNGYGRNESLNNREDNLPPLDNESFDDVTRWLIIPSNVEWEEGLFATLNARTIQGSIYEFFIIFNKD